MTGLLLLSLGALGWGAALLLERVPWCRRVRLARRLAPHVGATPTGATAASGVASGSGWWRDALWPAVQRVGDAASRSLGVTEPLPRRLARAGRTESPEDFRLRQLQHLLVGVAAGGLLAAASRGRPVLALAALVAGPAVGVLLQEHRLASALADRRRRTRLELPVIADQLAMLVSSGSSLPTALSRLGARGSGVVAEDLRRVVRRIRHGLDATAALEEWAEETDDDAVRRLVAVLALHREATDLGRLIAHEARAARQEAHRELVESIERRAQLVWVPVTVATLVPGVLFLAVPFVAALSGVAG
jgi:tight adherence protein C